VVSPGFAQDVAAKAPSVPDWFDARRDLDRRAALSKRMEEGRAEGVHAYRTLAPRGLVAVDLREPHAPTGAVRREPERPIFEERPRLLQRAEGRPLRERGRVVDHAREEVPPAVARPHAPPLRILSRLPLDR